jgi:hypothetical protein
MKKLLSVLPIIVIFIFAFSISIYASVEVRDDAPTTATVPASGGAWSIDVSTLFDVEDEGLDPDGFRFTKGEAPDGDYGFDPINKSIFSFDPNSLDAGQTFIFYFYVKGNGSGSGLGTEKRHSISVTVTLDKEPTPTADIDYVNDKLTGLTAGSSYTITKADATTVPRTANASGEIDTIDGFLGTEVFIVKHGNGTSTIASDPQELYIPARPSAPTVYSVTLGTADGRITGLDKTKTYEYKVKDASNETIETISGVREIIGLAPTDYQVRFDASEERFASGWANVRVFEYDAPKTPILTSLTISEGTMSPAFDSGVIEYTATVPYGISSVTISASSNFMKTGTGVKSLSVGENIIQLQAYNSTNGTTRVYYVTITRQAYVPPQEEPKPAPVIPEPKQQSMNTPDYNAPAPPSPPIVTPIYEIIENMDVTAKLNKSGSVDSNKTRLEILRAARTPGTTQITLILPENCKGISTAAIQKLVKAAGDKKLFLVYDGVTVRLTSKTKQILTLAYYDSL